MPWFNLAIFASLFKSFANISEKAVLTKEPARIYVSTFSFVIAFISLPLLFFAQKTSIPTVDIGIIYLASFLSVGAALTAAYAIKNLEISESAALFALSPISVALFAIYFLGENLSSLQLIGICVSVFGVYILEHPFNHHLIVGIKPEPKPSNSKIKLLSYICLIVSIILFSVDSIMGRYIIHYRGVDIITGLVISQFFILINILLFDTIQSTRLFKKNSHSSEEQASLKAIDTSLFVKTSFWSNVIFLLIHRIFHLLAVSVVQISVLNAVKQLSAIITTIIGGRMFTEKNMLRKTVGCVFIVIGVIFVALN